MDDQRQQVAERIKQANNILVTVSTNPSVDQLSACIGLTLALNKLGKHATAVFSGNIPSTIEFLQPEKTIERNTDSLRDFIIALDKAKADKLRYKVEDKVVKIFITPYRTSISDKDLEFSQGDFNVDVVIALGVHAQSDLDQAITSHGRILHDATVITMNTKSGGEFGSLNWLDPTSSSLSELTVQLVDMIDKKAVDGQIATAFLTGIVAETERFSNTKTTPRTMSISAELMSEGANQQLVATKLEEPVVPAPSATGPIAQQDAHEGGTATDLPPKPPKPDDGTLEISHDDTQDAKLPEPEETPAGLTDATQDIKEPEEEKGQLEKFPLKESESAEKVDTEDKSPNIQDEHEHKHPKIHDVKTGGEDATPHEAKKEPAKKEEPLDIAALLPEPTESDVSNNIPVISSQSEPVIPEIVNPTPPPQIHIDEQGAMNPVAANQDEIDKATESLLSSKPKDSPAISHHNEPPKMMLEPPVLGGQLSANAMPGTALSGEDAISGLPGVPVEEPPLLDGQQDGSKDAPLTAPPAPSPNETLSDIERDVHSPHVAAMMPSAPSSSLPHQPQPFEPASSVFSEPSLPPQQAVQAPKPVQNEVPIVKPDITAAAPPMPQQPDVNKEEPLNGFTDINSARNAVEQAINANATPALDPIQALNANPMGSPITGGQPQDSAGLPAESLVDGVTSNDTGQYGPDPNAPAVQPWIPPADTPPPFPPVMPGTPNPATQFDPAAFGQPPLPADSMNTFSGPQPVMPPAAPPPIAPQK